MKISVKNPVKTVNLLCAAVMILLVLMQFLPFWTVEDTGVSVMGYMGFPDDHSNLTSWLDDTVSGGFVINNLVGWFFFTTALSIVGSVLCIRYREKSLIALLPAACGIVGILYCASEPAFRLGQGWILQLLLYCLLLVLPVLSILHWAKGLINENT